MEEGSNSDLSMDLSAYAELFGESQNPLFKGTGKSGLTPTEAIDPSLPLSPKSAKTKLYENYQRGILQGFTTRELEDAGCLEHPTAQPCDLKCPLHPLLQRKNWLDSDDPIGDGYSGNWGGGQDEVWRVLKTLFANRNVTYL
jgi:hypothetical protein